MKRPIEVLIIEDNPGDAFLISELLREVGVPINITLAQDGQTALDILNREDGHAVAPVPDFVILDLNLPNVHGFEVLDRMKRSPSLRELPVAVLTGSLNRDDEIKARRMGVVDFRVKPAASNEMDSTIEWLRKNLCPMASSRPTDRQEPPGSTSLHCDGPQPLPGREGVDLLRPDHAFHPGPFDLDRYT